MNTVSRYAMALCLFTSLLGQPIQASQNNWSSTAWTIGKCVFGLAATYIGYLGLQYLTKNYTKKAEIQPWTELTFINFLKKYTPGYTPTSPELALALPNGFDSKKAKTISGWLWNMMRAINSIGNIREEIYGLNGPSGLATGVERNIHVILNDMSISVKNFNKEYLTKEKRAFYETIHFNIDAVLQDLKNGLISKLIDILNGQYPDSARLNNMAETLACAWQDNTNSPWISIWNNQPQYNANTQTHELWTPTHLLENQNTSYSLQKKIRKIQDISKRIVNHIFSTEKILISSGGI